jgi:voltage-gated potassium channel Kch
MQDRNEELKNTTYEIFIGLLSVLSIINIVLFYVIDSQDVSDVILLMDNVLTVIFLADFAFRLFTAVSKREYFFHQFGWADLLASLPVAQLKILRLFRVFRAGRMLREFGPVGIVKEYVSNRANSALLTLLLIVILLLEFGSMAVLYIEQYADGASITSGNDAVWYTFVTITTVGYGDTYPVTDNGRLFGLLIMAIGVGVFGTLTGYLSNLFLSNPDDDDESEAAIAPELSADEAKVSLVELKGMLIELQNSQAALAEKIESIETHR